MNGTRRNWTAVIPLRAGSKGLPRKNIRDLAGKPLYRHAVDSALAAGASSVFVTTDIPEVLTAEMPAGVSLVHRPSELCGDLTPMESVLLHTLEKNSVIGPIVLLQATSPLRQIEDIHEALDQLSDGGFDMVMSVTEADRGILKWGQLGNNGCFIPISHIEHCFSNRQSLPSVYRPNGAIYAMQAEWFVANKGFSTQSIGTILMAADRSHDIDTLEDFEFCESLLTTKLTKNKL